MKKRNLGEGVFQICNGLVLLLVSLVTLYPFLYVIFASFSDPLKLMGNSSLLLKPLGFSLGAYKKVFLNPSIYSGYMNTVFYVTVGTLVNILATCMAAYVLSRKQFMLRRVLTIMFIFTMYFSGGMVPYYLQLKNLGMLDHFIVYIIPGMLNVYYMILIRSYIYGIPESLVESAKLDGANDLWVYGRIILPLSKPVVMTIVLFASIGHWNAWFDSRLYTNSMNLKTLQLVLVEILNQFQTSGTNGATLAQRAQMMSGVTQKSVQMAAVMVATIPIICVYPFVQKYFVKGIMIGAVKA